MEWHFQSCTIGICHFELRHVPSACDVINGDVQFPGDSSLL